MQAVAVPWPRCPCPVSPHPVRRFARSFPWGCALPCRCPRGPEFHRQQIRGPTSILLGLPFSVPSPWTRGSETSALPVGFSGPLVCSRGFEGHLRLPRVLTSLPPPEDSELLSPPSRSPACAALSSPWCCHSASTGVWGPQLIGPLPRTLPFRDTLLGFRVLPFRGAREPSNCCGVTSVQAFPRLRNVSCPSSKDP